VEKPTNERAEQRLHHLVWLLGSSFLSANSFNKPRAAFAGDMPHAV
jgi:hypothetical protein